MHIARITAGECDGEIVVEMHIDHRFIASWKKLGLTDEQTRTVEAMVREAVEEGKRIRSREFKALIG
jgi:hypothetical protein